ncbi:hypothetical protein [Promicromonospora sp. NPDC019610]|uniref:hypothetical protein n=1 Tax=Promicromonospora sp. NPDC019610 TaxID=3364405 RepID=UPI0037B6976D
MMGPTGRCRLHELAAATGLAELDSPTHLFWIGPHATQVHRAVQTFLAELL